MISFDIPHQPHILWVEDDKTTTSNWVPILETYGFRFDTAANGEEGLNKIKKKKYDKILLDLDMPKINGVEVLRALEFNNCSIPITILSAYVDEPVWIRRLSNLKKSYSSIKAPLSIVTTPHFNEALETIKNGLPTNTINISLFDIPFSDFIKLTPEEIASINSRIYANNEEWVSQKMNDLSAIWLIVCGGEILGYSSNLNDAPSDEEIYEIGATTKQVPFLFFRAPLIEESSWNNTPTGDFYPTLNIQVHKKENSKQYRSDFDTGSDSTFLDFDELKSLELVEQGIFDLEHESHHLNKKYRYIRKKMLISLIEQRNIISQKEINCVLVKDFKRSPFLDVNPNRSALTGRDMLNQMSVIVTLNSESRKTTVQKP
ncbi:MAG: response regulator [Bacteroidales bacterium]